jgi:hypothetical protein
MAQHARNYLHTTAANQWCIFHAYGLAAMIGDTNSLFLNGQLASQNSASYMRTMHLVTTCHRNKLIPLFDTVYTCFVTNASCDAIWVCAAPPRLRINQFGLCHFQPTTAKQTCANTSHINIVHYRRDVDMFDIHSGSAALLLTREALANPHAAWATSWVFTRSHTPRMNINKRVSCSLLESVDVAGPPLGTCSMSTKTLLLLSTRTAAAKQPAVETGRRHEGSRQLRAWFCRWFMAGWPPAGTLSVGACAVCADFNMQV